MIPGTIPWFYGSYSWLPVNLVILNDSRDYCDSHDFYASRNQAVIVRVILIIPIDSRYSNDSSDTLYVGINPWLLGD